MKIWFLLLLLSIFFYLCNNESCFDDEDCDDLKWCNGNEICVNETCINGENPCQLLIDNIMDINNELGYHHLQVLCYENEHLCLTRYRCFSNKDCNDNFSCNGEEICDLETNLCIKSNKNICKSDEICDFKQNKCVSLKSFELIRQQQTSSQQTYDIVITVLISVCIIFIITMLLIMVLSYYIFKNHENK